MCDIPTLEPGVTYVAEKSALGEDLVLQVDFLCKDDGSVTMTCCNLGGEEVLRFSGNGSDLAWKTQQLIAGELRVDLQSLHLVLPDRQLLVKVCRAKPGLTLAEVCSGSAPHE